MNATQDTTKLLNGLIETLIDGQEGFKTASKALATTDPALSNELMGYSAQRQEFAQELRNMVQAVGEKAAESGSAAGAMHRGWINLKTAISSNDRHAILAECERGEDSAVDEYRKALEAGSPAEFDPVLTNQYSAVKATHDRVKALRDAAKGG